MAFRNFDLCLAVTLRHEGGYADHPADPGGATNLGITRATLAAWRGRPVSKDEVRALTRTEAATIYRARYWAAVGGDDLPAGVDLAVFDFAVNSGPRRALQALASACGVPLAEARKLAAEAGRRDGAVLIRAISAGRRGFLGRLRIFPVFGRGWLRRIADVERTALSMVRGQIPTLQTEKSSMERSKSFLQSRTVWSNVVGLAALVASILGFSLVGIDQSAVVDAVLTTVAGLSFIASTIFRVAATKSLK